MVIFLHSNTAGEITLREKFRVERMQEASSDESALKNLNTLSDIQKLDSANNLNGLPKRGSRGLLAGDTATTLSSSNTSVTSLKNEEKPVVLSSKYSFYWINKKDNDKIYKTLVELPNDCTVQEATEEILPYFNEFLIGQGIRLDMDSSLYGLYFAKKTGHPKADYPALAGPQVLHLTSMNAFTLVEKNPNAIIKLETSTVKQKSGTRGSVRSSPRKSTGSNRVKDSTNDSMMVNPPILRPEEQMADDSSLEVVLKLHQAEPEESDVTTYCWCIKLSSKKPKEKNTTLSIKAENDESLKKPLIE